MREWGNDFIHNNSRVIGHNTMTYRGISIYRGHNPASCSWRQADDTAVVSMAALQSEPLIIGQVLSNRNNIFTCIMQTIITQHPKANWMYPLIPDFSFLFSAHDIGKIKQWGTILDFFFILHTATLRDVILKCHVLSKKKKKKNSSTYRFKPRLLKKASRLLFPRLRSSFPISFLESYINFRPLARFFFTPHKLCLAFHFLNPPCSFMPSTLYLWDPLTRLSCLSQPGIWIIQCSHRKPFLTTTKLI